MKNKNILFMPDEIPGYKESMKTALKFKFKAVSSVDSDFPKKKDRSISFRIIWKLYAKTNLTIFKSLHNKLIGDFQNKLIDELPFSYDYFMVCSSRNISSEFINKIKGKNKNIKCILFLWDKVENIESELKFNFDDFDYIFTFEPKDALNFNLIFRPSFFIDNCLTRDTAWHDKKYSVLYVGVLRDLARYNFVEELYNNHLSDAQKNSSFLKLYVRQEYEHHLPKIVNNNIITYDVLDYRKLIEKMIDSKVVLDLAVSNQQGLTLRAIESIATKTKVITTNKNIVNYDFYNKDNILIVDPNNFTIPTEFFENPFTPLPEAIVKKYSTSGFIDEIFYHIKNTNNLQVSLNQSENTIEKIGSDFL